jgi:hypothetical protein
MMPPMPTLVRRAGSAVALTLVLASCSTTKILQAWVAPGFDGKTVKKVLVLGISSNPSLRRTYEDSFSVQLEKYGKVAISGYLWAPDAASLDRDAIMARMYKENVTHVLVTRLVASQDVATYHAPATMTVGVGYGPGYYGSWSSYYSVGYTTAVSPGYTTVEKVVTLETNLYDASKPKDALVWSGESETWTDGSQSGAKIDEVISALVYQMRVHRVL